MLEITTAERIIDTEIERQVGRRAAREAPVMRTIYQAFLARGAPVPVEDVMAAVPDMSRDAVASRLTALDEDDLIQIVDGKVETAYPFTARPTPFVVRPATGGERYACCAVDTLRMAPMLGQRAELVGYCRIHKPLRVKPAKEASATDVAGRIAARWQRKGAGTD